MLKFLTLAAVAAVAGCATQTPETHQLDTASSLTQSSQAQMDCLKTGTRIRLSETECAATSGRSFSSEEIQQTGAFDLADALRKLDPSLGR